MTTEDDFQNALDAQPDDWHTRLVFADWLDEHADPRAAGYRALGLLKRRAYVCGFDNGTAGAWLGASWVACTNNGDKRVYTVAADWYKVIDGFGDDPRYKPRYNGKPERKVTRRAIEDAMALAFGRLTAARQKRLLKAHL